MIDPRLLEWARLPGPAKVLKAARRRLEAGHGMGGSPLRVSLTAAERDEVGRLLGVKWALSGRAVGAGALSAAVDSLGTDMTSLLVALGGPLRDRPAEREASVREAAAEQRLAIETLTEAGVPCESARAWVERRGLPKAGTGRLLELARQCAAVWRELPRNGVTLPLAVLANSALQDPHGLDRGSPTATGVLRLLGKEVPATAESWRAVWEDHGIVVDPVSSRALVLNLRLRGDAPACRLTQAAAGEPLWLTWRSLVGLFRTSEPDVYVCENPSIVIAAADRLGERSRPLVCTNGRPSAATRRLLLGLATTGTLVHLRADDDDAGQAIVSGLLNLMPTARLWRYELRSPTSPRYEEQELDTLLADLNATR